MAFIFPSDGWVGLLFFNSLDFLFLLDQAKRN